MKIESTKARFIHSVNTGVCVGYVPLHIVTGGVRIRVGIAFLNTDVDSYNKEMAREVVMQRINDPKIIDAGMIMEYYAGNDLSIDNLIQTMNDYYQYFLKNLGKAKTERLFDNFLDVRFKRKKFRRGAGYEPMSIYPQRAYQEFTKTTIERPVDIKMKRVLTIHDHPNYYIKELDGYVKFFHSPLLKASIGYVEDEQNFHVAIAACHPNDVYSKKISRNVITSRFNIGKFISVEKSDLCDHLDSDESERTFLKVCEAIQTATYGWEPYDVTNFNIPKWRIDKISDFNDF